MRDNFKTVTVFAGIFILTLLISSAALCEPITWVCPKCGRTGNTDKYCGICAYPSPAPGERISAAIGSILKFGHYEQDDNIDNGKEPIEWIVLDYDETEGKVLLLSKYGLDAKKYNDWYENTTWEQCALRYWLNGEFMLSAFSTEEQAAILMTDVDNSAAQGNNQWEIEGGNNTQDRIFLLSYAEANRYLDVTKNSNIKARVAPTAYAIAQGAYIARSNKTAEGMAAGWWWLRSPGFDQNSAATIRDDGSSSIGGNSVNFPRLAVRPAFWLSLKSANLK